MPAGNLPSPGRMSNGPDTMKRIGLFLATNIAVLVVIAVIVNLLGLGRIADANGLNLGTLLALSAVIGFTGAIISLLISKPMAKWQTGAQVITQPANADERWLLDTVRKLSAKAGVTMPEVAIYEGEPNAFATGAFKNSALVAVSTGLLSTMNQEEVEAVLAHEVSHVANGDMVTMTLIQGVVNTFVVFLSRLVGYLVDKQINKDGNGQGIGYFVTSIVCQIVFGILASMIVAWFSRHREFRADAGAADYMGQPNSMINALARLGRVEPGELPKSIEASGISDRPSVMALFSTHPPIEERIEALRRRGQ
jgi:heat shock protein HtpX